MKITVNDLSFELPGGAKVNEAILKYNSLQGKKMPKDFPLVVDGFGNRVADDGELSDGNRLFIKKAECKKHFSLLNAFVFLLALVVLSQGNINGQPIQGKGRQAVILAVNDMHASIDYFPKFAALVDSLRGLYPELLVFAAGDNQTGNPINDLYPEKGLPMIELMNAVRFDLSALGNHEFDTHPDGLKNLITKADFGFVCANLTVPMSFGSNIAPYKIFTLPNGLRIAALGLIQIGMNGIPDTHPDNVAGFGFKSPFLVAPEFINSLKDQCDALVILSHIGFESDVNLAETMPPGVDLIIGGHSHTRVDKDQVFNDIMIVQAENKLKYATLIKLTSTEDGRLVRERELISIRDFSKENQTIRQMVDRYNDNPEMNQVLAIATDDFSSYNELGYLMADAQRFAANADIALLNPGGVRLDHLAKGNIRMVDVFKLDPFGNDLVLFKLTGHELKGLMRAAFPVDDKAPLYTSGLRTDLFISADGQLNELTLYTDDGQLLDLDKTYRVAMNSYMAAVYQFSHDDPGQSLFTTTSDGLISYLKTQKNVRSYRNEIRFLLK